MEYTTLFDIKNMFCLVLICNYGNQGWIRLKFVSIIHIFKEKIRVEDK